MKKVEQWFFGAVTALSMVMAVAVASSASIFMSYQPECPEELIK